LQIVNVVAVEKAFFTRLADTQSACGIGAEEQQRCFYFEQSTDSKGVQMNRKYVWLFFAVFAGLSILFAAGKPVNLLAQEDKKLDIPVLEYESEIRKDVTGERKAKSAHFNGRGNPDRSKRIAELPQGVEVLPSTSHWWIGLSALPVTSSDMIVLGEIIDAAAHFSDDRTGIYSEFSIGVSDYFKDTTESLSVGKTISANRIGGGVKFASGKIQQYRLGRQGMPIKGTRYLLFLRREEGGDLTILTGYALLHGRVIPLDGEDNPDPRSALPFSRYKGAEESQLLQDLLKEIQGGAK